MPPRIKRYRLLLGDVAEIVRDLLEPASFHGCLCDPPYGLSFMGKRWDYAVPSVETWREVAGVLVPGAHLLAFAGTRTQHRMAVNIEDAGFEIRDMIAWVYGSGFPKSLDVSKAIDKAAGATRKVVGPDPYSRRRNKATPRFTGTQYANGKEWQGLQTVMRTAPATLSSAQWQGYGTTLKPALEPITVARKPLRGTVAANVLAFGTGAINVDGCRVGGEPWKAHRATGLGSVKFFTEGEAATIDKEPHTLGRWPANLIHDGSEEVLAGFPETTSGGGKRNGPAIGGVFSDYRGDDEARTFGANSGSAARFFYCAKAGRSEREAGLREAGGIRTNAPRANEEEKNPRTLNHHPTVKPLALAEYLARLILPPKLDKPRRLLVPFCGSGSEIIGALRAGWDEIVGIDLEESYLEIAKARIDHYLKGAA